MKESLWFLFEEQITEEQDRKEADQEVMENPGMRWQWLGLLGSSEVSKKRSDSMYILQPKSNIQFKLRASERSRIIPTFLGLDNQKGQLRWQRPGRAR